MGREDDGDVKFSKMTERGETSSKLADLWLRNEGSKVDLFKRDGNSPDSLRTATALMEWVRSGFGAEHNDGKPFVPTSLIDELGGDGAKVALSMTRLAKKQGLFTGDDKAILSMHDELKQRAMNNSSDHTLIDSLLTPLAHDAWSDQKSQILSKALTESKGKVSPAMLKGLKENFGPQTDDLINHFKAKAEAAKEPSYGKSTPQHRYINAKPHTRRACRA